MDKSLLRKAMRTALRVYWIVGNSRLPLPSKDDTLLSSLMKLEATAREIATEVFEIRGETIFATLFGLKKADDVLNDLVALCETSFPKTSDKVYLDQMYSYHRIKIGDKQLWKMREVGDGFYAGSAFVEAENPINYEDLFQAVWDKFGPVCMCSEPQGLLQLERVTPGGDLYGSTLEFIERFRAKHDRIHQTHPRTYLFLGPPGVGKTTSIPKIFAGKKILYFPATLVREYRVTLLNFLRTVRPEVLVLEDFDRGVIVNASVLNLFEEIQKLGIAMVITANSIRTLPDAILRPGRIDEIIEFPKPDEMDRGAILKGYMAQYGVRDLAPEELRQVLDATTELSPAYLREIVIQLNVEPLEVVLDIINKMHDILQRKHGKGFQVLSSPVEDDDD